MDVINSLFAREFPVNTTHVYLNHAAVAPWPVRASQAVGRFAEENSQIGASHYLQWLDVKNTLRQQLATLCHAHIDEIAFVKNTSEALSFVAAGIDWQAGDVVLISDEEFPSNRIVWEALADQGVIVRKVSLQGDDPNAALERELSNGIKLLAISAVQYGSGIAVDLVRLGRICKQHNVLFCVDAIQVIGAMPFDVNEIQCDFAMADGHKWMLGPEGLGVFYVRRERISQLKLVEYGWHMVEHQGDYSRKDWQPAQSARRFECGSPNILAAHALSASLSLLLEIGIEQVADHIRTRLAFLLTGLTELGAEILTPEHSLGLSGIITFRFQGVDSAQLYKKLMERKVICANRGGGVRFAPHCHTPESAMAHGLNILSELVNALR